MSVNSLQMECNKCRVASTCPRKGSSPLSLNSGKKVFCQIINGYGRIPVDVEILSTESLKRSKVDGPCLTIAEVPTIDEHSGNLIMEITKIFSRPILHEREILSFNQEMIYPKSHT